ncbi:MAG: PRC-barrel domain-containing protein [Bacillota bacterium]
MKRSEELLGLSVISIEDGKEVGVVRDLIVNPAERAVECLVVDKGSRYQEVKILPFSMVEGVGEYAVTIQSADAITDMSEHAEIQRLLELNVQVKGTKVATKKGRLIGSVREYFVDEDGKGKIDACELVPANGEKNTKLIKAEYVITFGKDILVVEENVEEGLISSPASTVTQTNQQAAQPAQPPATAQPEAQETPEQAPVEKKPDVSDAARLFEERQRQYLIGRKLSKRIVTDDGEVLGEEGDAVTAELIDKAKACGKYTELSMNTRS